MLHEKSLNIILVRGLIPKAISTQCNKIVVLLVPKRVILYVVAIILVSVKLKFLKTLLVSYFLALRNNIKKLAKISASLLFVHLQLF
jgi:hypothetical protein